MAKIIQNHKGFKIIQMTSAEAIKAFGGVGICDSCNGNHQKDYNGYYIAVLNRYYCQQDYDEWIAHAIRYEDDVPYENRSFNYAKHKLGL